MPNEIIPVTTTVQAAWDSKSVDWKTKDAVVLTLKNGDNGPLRIEQGGTGKVDLVLRVPAGGDAKFSSGGGVPISTDETPKQLRVVINGWQGTIHTDCEREYTEELGVDGLPERTYTGDPKTALDFDGLTELVILGKGTERDIHGQPAIERIRFSHRVEINGDRLRSYLDEGTVTLFIPRDRFNTHAYDEVL